MESKQDSFKMTGIEKPTGMQETVKVHEMIYLQELGLSPSFVTDGIMVRPKNQSYWTKILYEDILWIKALNNDCEIHFLQKSIDPITISVNMKHVAAALPIRYFVKINRSEIINITYVKEWDGNTFWLCGLKQMFTVAEKYRKYVFSCFLVLKKNGPCIGREKIEDEGEEENI